ncbi:MAG: hypothetical protein K2N03_04550 [Muribaculaceae bacterium]|nr:hypothetical protein [Muribaculaceae bacterium]
MEPTIRVSSPLKGSPASFETELQKRVYEKLETLGIDFMRVENEPAVTMEDCKAIDKAFGNPTVKTVFLTNRQKTALYLYVMPAEKPFITKEFGAALSIPRVSFASTEMLMDILGTPHGAASPLSLLTDPENKVRIILDHEIMEMKRISVTDTTLHGFISMPPEELRSIFIPSTGHTAEII